VDKKAIFTEILRELKREFATMATSALEAKVAATHEESKAEDKYDTRGLEASYLAGAQAVRAQAIRKSITILEKLEIRNYLPTDAIGSTALVTLECDGKNYMYFLLPDSGGIRVQVNGATVTTLSLESPLGEQLINKKVGDEFQFSVGGNEREYTIQSIS
jgi:transcription elongation GreA/GreB family factor